MWAIAGLLADLTDCAVVPSSAKTSAIAAKVKTNKINAVMLAKLLTADFLCWRGCLTPPRARCGDG